MKTKRAHGAAIALSVALALSFGLFLAARHATIEASIHLASEAVWSIEELTDEAPDPSEPIPVEVGERDGPLLVPVPFAARQKTTSDTPAKPLPRRGLMVSLTTVRRAIESRAIPSGQAVPATDKHPAGVMFTSPAGPFRTGDILLTVGGTRAVSEGAVVRAALGAVKSGASAIGGEIHRDGVTLPFAIMIPPEAKALWSSTEGTRRHKKTKKKKKQHEESNDDAHPKTRAQRALD